MNTTDEVDYVDQEIEEEQMLEEKHEHDSCFRSKLNKLKEKGTFSLENLFQSVINHESMNTSPVINNTESSPFVTKKVKNKQRKTARNKRKKHKED